MAEKKTNGLLKFGLELGPIAVFFLAYRWAAVPEGVTESEEQLAKILFATTVFIPVILASLALSWVLTRNLPKMAVMTAVLVVVFGKYLMDEVVPMQVEGWMKFTFRFMLFFVMMAITNEIVWRNFDTDTWVNFRTFFLPVASFIFVMTQAGLFMKYGIDEDEADET